jgi:hypothetical protein
MTRQYQSLEHQYRQSVYVALFDLVSIPYKCSIFTVSEKMWYVMGVTDGPLTFLRLVFTRVAQ